ncbi:MAG: hypothetical protein HDQ96_16255 [Lachnospiraceae bacterium]|nr:hypothetical protein [Lachnospiraceae bacterium]
MNCYLLKELGGARTPNIQNYNQTINYRAFEQNQPYKLPERSVCILNAPFDTSIVLFDPFPLFSSEAKKSLELFLWDCRYKEFIFLDQKNNKREKYFLPFFYRIKGRLGRQEDGKETSVYLESPWPKDIPVVYLQTEQQILVLIRLDLLESLMRKGLCGVEVIPVKLRTGGAIDAEH